MRRTLCLLLGSVALLAAALPVAVGPVSALDPTPMTLTFSTALGGDTLMLPFTGSVTIDWGDGTSPGSDLTHTYSSSGLYEISVTGSASQFGPGGRTGYAGITSVGSYGTLGLTSLYGAFAGATNLIDVPDLPSSITDVSSMFNGATSFNESISNWDTSNVTTMEGMFAGATSFNNGCAVGVTTCPLDPANGKLNTSKVERFVAMFNGTLDPSKPMAFNQRVSNLSLASATALDYMFRDADAFNNGCAAGTFTCPLTSTATAWNSGNVTGLSHMFLENSGFNQSISGMDVGSVTNMGRMFDSATAFNNGCAVGVTTCPMTDASWDTSKVADMRQMMQLATSFDQDVSTWDFSSLQDGWKIFYNTSLSMVHYNALLVHLASLTLPTGRYFTAYPTKYAGAAAIAAHAKLTGTGDGEPAWNIWDGGEGVLPTYPSTISAITPTGGTRYIGADLTVGSTVKQTTAGTACDTAGANAPTYTLSPDPTGVGDDLALTAGAVSTVGWAAGTYTMTVDYPGDGTCDATSDDSTELTMVAPAVPSAPASVIGVRGERKVSVAWTPPATDGGLPVLGYVVEVKAGSGPWGAAKGGCAIQNTVASTELDCVATGLDKTTTYTVRVTAKNAVGASEPTTTVALPPARTR